MAKSFLIQGRILHSWQNLFSFSPGFSRVKKRGKSENRFNGFLVRALGNR
jgi:hypothetical protein